MYPALLIATYDVVTSLNIVVLFGSRAMQRDLIAVGSGVAVMLRGVGVAYFRRKEHVFSDVAYIWVSIRILRWQTYEQSPSNRAWQS